MKWSVRQSWKLLWLVLLYLFLGMESSYGAGLEYQDQEAYEEKSEDWPLKVYEIEKIQGFLDGNLGKETESLSFLELMEGLIKGNFMEVAGEVGDALYHHLFSELKQTGSLVGQIMALGLLGAVFGNFSHIFSSSQVAESGFFVTYLLLFTILAASFFASVQVAVGVISEILEFMKILMPSYFMAVAFVGGSMTAAAFYQLVMMAVTVIQWAELNVLIPMVKIYLLFVLAGHIAKEEMLSRLTGLIENGVVWSLKTMAGLLIGLHLIQGMILPYVDSMKHSGIRKLVEVIPGIGQGAGVMTQMVLGSGVLIKNAMGTAGIVVLVFIALVPVLKLLIMMLLYQCVAAVLEPVCDKRMVSCLEAVARGHKLLLAIVMTALFLFMIIIALLCTMTNISYYA